MASVFEQVSGLNSAPIATIASFAMINGILVQVVMASRVLYGMASDRQISPFFALVSVKRQTPARATAVVGALIIVLLSLFPLVQLARATSIVTLTVFTMVNVALVRLAHERPGGPLWRWRFNGMAGALASASLCIWQIVQLIW